MTKVVLLFPGQGSQYVGMASKFKGHKLLEQANSALDFNLENLMLEGPAEDLTLTMNTQPAIVTHSLILFEELKPLLEKAGASIECVLGHSVGEYAALSAAGALNFTDAVKAVNQRGKYMQEAVPAGVGGMLAVLKVPEEVVVKGCEEVSKTHGKIMPANFNDPTQIVISGELKAIEEFPNWLKENYEKPSRAIPLKVSAPFHSSLMEPAANAMKDFLESISFEKLSLPYIANVDAKLYGLDTEAPTIKSNLVTQMAGSVLWTQSIRTLDSDVKAIEVGPGKVLTGLMRKINPEIKVHTLDKDDSFEKLEEFLLS
ncbi:MAG: ACP S-malonyltransferase [Bacteriovoracaceae bacterium]